MATAKCWHLQDRNEDLKRSQCQTRCFDFDNSAFCTILDPFNETDNETNPLRSDVVSFAACCPCRCYRQTEVVHRRHAFRAGEFHARSAGQERQAYPVALPAPCNSSDRASSVGNISKPYEQLIVGDGKKFWMYDIDLNQVTVKKLDAALGSSPAALLSGNNEIERGFVLKEHRSIVMVWNGCKRHRKIVRDQL